jgi:hypothetical protein
MASFHFVVRTDTHVLSSGSVDLSSLEAARVAASTRIGDLLKTHAEAIWVDKEWQMDVTDAAGLILFVINVSAMKSAATGSSN